MCPLFSGEKDTDAGALAAHELQTTKGFDGVVVPVPPSLSVVIQM